MKCGTSVGRPGGSGAAGSESETRPADVREAPIPHIKIPLKSEGTNSWRKESGVNYYKFAESSIDLGSKASLLPALKRRKNARASMRSRVVFHETATLQIAVLAWNIKALPEVISNGGRKIVFRGPGVMV